MQTHRITLIKVLAPDVLIFASQELLCFLWFFLTCSLFYNLFHSREIRTHGLTLKLEPCHSRLSTYSLFQNVFKSLCFLLFLVYPGLAIKSYSPTMEKRDRWIIRVSGIQGQPRQQSMNLFQKLLSKIWAYRSIPVIPELGWWGQEVQKESKAILGYMVGLRPDWVIWNCFKGSKDPKDSKDQRIQGTN